MAGEQSSLLASNAERGYDTTGNRVNTSTGDPVDDLAQRSQDIVTWARQRVTREEGVSTEISYSSHIDEAHLAVLLYAIYVNAMDLARRTSTLKDGFNARQNLLERQRAQAAGEILRRYVLAYFDGGTGTLATRQATAEDRRQEQDATGGATSSGDPGGAEEEEMVEDVLWHPWTFGGNQFTGGHINDEGDLRVGGLRSLERYITPRRTHLLHLISFLVPLILTVSLAVCPGHWLDPIDRHAKSPGVREIVYIVWVYSTLLNALPNITRTIFLLPSALVPILSYFDSNSAFSILAFSILPLTFRLLLPISPSLVMLDDHLVPLSTLLMRIASRGFRSAGLILPLALIAFAVFAWSLNGDIFRGFDVIQIVLPSDARLGRLVEPPVEEGIAPFETRIWLFVTFISLFFASVCLTLVRALRPDHHRGPETSNHSDDPWEVDYGPAVASSARQNWATAIRFEVEHKQLVPPLSLLVNGLLPLDEVLFVLRRYRITRTRTTLKMVEAKLRRAREMIWLCTMGPLCLPLYLWDRLLETLRTR